MKDLLNLLMFLIFMITVEIKWWSQKGSNYGGRMWILVRHFADFLITSDLVSRTGKAHICFININNTNLSMFLIILFWLWITPCIIINLKMAQKMQLICLSREVLMNYWFTSASIYFGNTVFHVLAKRFCWYQPDYCRNSRKWSKSTWNSLFLDKYIVWKCYFFWTLWK